MHGQGNFQNGGANFSTPGPGEQQNGPDPAQQSSQVPTVGYNHLPYQFQSQVNPSIQPQYTNAFIGRPQMSQMRPQINPQAAQRFTQEDAKHWLRLNSQERQQLAAVNPKFASLNEFLTKNLQEGSVPTFQQRPFMAPLSSSQLQVLGNAAPNLALRPNPSINYPGSMVHPSPQMRVEASQPPTSQAGIPTNPNIQNPSMAQWQYGMNAHYQALVQANMNNQMLQNNLSASQGMQQLQPYHLSQMPAHFLAQQQQYLLQQQQQHLLQQQSQQRNVSELIDLTSVPELDSFQAVKSETGLSARNSTYPSQNAGGNHSCLITDFFI